VSIWNRDRTRAERLQASLVIPGVTLAVVDDIAQALPAADIVSTATRSESPLLLGRHLPAGVHLDLVGAYSREMVEADPAALAMGNVYIDAWDGAKQEAGDLIQAVEQGFLTWDDVVGDLEALVCGRIPARQGNEVTIFKSVGCAIEDLAAAAAAMYPNR
jgi:ornithine cyclodeaminase